MAKTKKQIKIEQANMQTDALTSDGMQWTGDSFSYSFADLDNEWDTADINASYTIDVDSDTDLMKKYPALQDAWDHYQNVKHMCEQKEKEDEN
jgi:hypothetical protein